MLANREPCSRDSSSANHAGIRAASAASNLPGTDHLLDRALDWIDRHLGEFDPLSVPSEFNFGRGQRLGELAILARTVAPLPCLRDDQRIDRMVALLERTQLSRVYRDRLLRVPIEFMLFLETYSSLRALGRDDPGMRVRLERAIRFRWLDQTERFPHRTMDIRSCLDSCDLPCDLPTLDELFQRSILGSDPNPILVNEHDLYALTHVIMFICDFGRRPPQSLPDERIEELAALLGALSVVATRDRHWDLLGEFLLCWSCLELPETPLIEKAELCARVVYGGMNQAAAWHSTPSAKRTPSMS